VAAAASSAQRTACLRHSFGSPGASISRSRTKCSLLSFWRQRLGRVWFDGSSSEEFSINRSIRPSGQSKFYAWPRKPARATSLAHHSSNPGSSGWRRPRTGNRCHQHFGISRPANDRLLRPFRQQFISSESSGLEEERNSALGEARSDRLDGLVPPRVHPRQSDRDRAPPPPLRLTRSPDRAR
jgi:hypothetical protein